MQTRPKVRIFVHFIPEVPSIDSDTFAFKWAIIYRFLQFTSATVSLLQNYHGIFSEFWRRCPSSIDSFTNNVSANSSDYNFIKSHLSHLKPAHTVVSFSTDDRIASITPYDANASFYWRMNADPVSEEICKVTGLSVEVGNGLFAVSLSAGLVKVDSVDSRWSL